MTFPSDLDLKELLPCPFCGGHVDVEKTHIGPMGRQFWGVKCRNTRNVGGTCAIEQIPSGSRETAIARWNSRATPVAPVPVELVVAGPTPDYTGEGSAWVPPVEARAVVVPWPKLPILDLNGDPLRGISLEMFRRGWGACATAVRAISAGRVLGEGMLSIHPDVLNSISDALREIGDTAHNASTGPEVPDVLWEIREKAYEAYIVSTDAEAEIMQTANAHAALSSLRANQGEAAT